jgi:serine/threonine protein kinase
MTERAGRSSLTEEQSSFRDDATRQLVGLLLEDQSQRWRQGQRFLVEKYVVQKPEVENDSEALLMLIYHEIVLREAKGDAPDLEEYLRRFPQLAAQLRLQFQLHAAVQALSKAGTKTSVGNDSAPEPRQAPQAVGPEFPRVSGYEMLAEIGRGGMGVVYKARQLRLNRLVALKMVLTGTQASAEDLVRFLNEAQAVARLQHPNIVQIHEFGQHEGRAYFTMEFVEGSSLAQRLAGIPLRPREAAQMVGTLARAVRAAHRRGIIHCDLKPANILLAPVESSEFRAQIGTPEPGSFDPGLWQPKIADFGLARWMECERLLEERTLLGTPSYMPPEQAGGTVREIRPSADVYSLGAILYELLTGRAPFKGTTTTDTVRQLMSQPPVPPSHLQPDVPRDLELICLKCLEKDAVNRYPTAKTFAEDLARFLAGEPIAAHVGQPEAQHPKSLRNRLPSLRLLSISGMAALALLCVIIIILSETRFEHATAAADRLRLELEHARANEHRIRYLHSIVLAHDQYRNNHLQRAEVLLDSSPSRFRGWEWSYLKQACHGRLPIVHRGQGNIAQVTFSPDGKLLAAISEGGTVMVWDKPLEAQSRLIKSLRGLIRSVAFSPDSKRLALACGMLVGNDQEGQVAIVEVASGRELLSLEGRTQLAHSLAFSPDGNQLAAACASKTATVWDAQTGHPSFSLQGHIGQLTHVTFSPDGKRLATASVDRSIKIWTATGQEIGMLQGHGDTVTCVVFSPDRRHLATSSADGTIKIWDSETANDVRTFQGHTGAVSSVAFTNDGRRLASAGSDGTVRIWDVETGLEALTLDKHVGPVSSLGFNDDNSLLATASNAEVKIWNASPPDDKHE